jgi:hypothetical protein
MHGTRLSAMDPDDSCIRVRLPKGVLLVLTRHEFARALKRGKAERRAQRFHRITSHDPEDTYDPEAWITKEGYYGPRYPGAALGADAD